MIHWCIGDWRREGIRLLGKGVLLRGGHWIGFWSWRNSIDPKNEGRDVNFLEEDIVDFFGIFGAAVNCEKDVGAVEFEVLNIVDESEKEDKLLGEGGVVGHVDV